MLLGAILLLFLKREFEHGVPNVYELINFFQCLCCGDIAEVKIEESVRLTGRHKLVHCIGVALQKAGQRDPRFVEDAIFERVTVQQ